jgi:hypothetical protein
MSEGKGRGARSRPVRSRVVGQVFRPSNQKRLPVPLFRSGLSSESSGQFLIHIAAMADSHETNHAGLAIDSINDSKTSDAILPQPLKFTLKRLPAFRVVRKGTNRGFDGTFQVRVEKSNDSCHMRRDIRAEGTHAVRRFLIGTTGSPNTSSNVSPFLLDR